MAGQADAPSTAQARGSDLISQYELGDEPVSGAPEPPPGSPPDGGGAKAPASPVTAPAGEAAPLTTQIRRPDGTFGKKHPQYLVQQAIDLGLSEDEIANTDTEVLGQSVRHMTRQAMSYARERQDAANLHEAMDRGRRGQEPERLPEGGPPESPLGLDETLYDSGLMGVLKAQARQIQELRGQLEQLAQSHRVQIQETTTQKFDRAIASLKNPGRFGTGAINALSSKSPEHARRLAVVQQAIRLAGDKASVDEITAKIPAAARILYEEQAVQPAPSQRMERTFTGQEWSEGTLAVPTQRSAPPEGKGVRAAERAVAAFQRDTTSANGVAAEDDDFPA